MTLPAVMRQKEIERALRAMRAVTGHEGMIVLSGREIRIMPQSAMPPALTSENQTASEDPGVVF